MSTAKYFEQRVTLKFFVKWGKSRTETFEALKQVHGDDLMPKSSLYDWYKLFKEGREECGDAPRSGRPVAIRNAISRRKVEEALKDDRRLSIREIAYITNINRETVRQIITEDLNMRKVCAKLVPKHLTDEQKANRVRICEDWLENWDIFENVITGDESWIFEYDPETQRQSRSWKRPDEPRPKKARMSRSQMKAMLVTFFDCRGLILKHWVPKGQSITAAYYIEVLKKLRRKIAKKRPEMWAANSWVLHHDNAPAHSAFATRNFLAKTSTAVLEHPAYSPDLAPNDFFMYPKTKEPMKGAHFQSEEVMKGACSGVMASMQEEDFQGCFESWKSRVEKCIRVGGDYIEGCNA